MSVRKVFDHVIVGGGLLGSSVAYHLSRLSGGATSICIVERGSRTDWATFGNSQYSTGELACHCYDSLRSWHTCTDTRTPTHPRMQPSVSNQPTIGTKQISSGL